MEVFPMLLGSVGEGVYAPAKYLCLQQPSEDESKAFYREMAAILLWAGMKVDFKSVCLGIE